MEPTDLYIPREEMERRLCCAENIPLLESLISSYYQKAMVCSLQQQPDIKELFESVVGLLQSGNLKEGKEAFFSAVEALADPPVQTEVPRERDLPALFGEVRQEVHSFLDLPDDLEPCFVQYSKLFGRPNAFLWKITATSFLGMGGAAGLSVVSEPLFFLPLGVGFGYFFCNGVSKLLQLYMRKSVAYYHPFSRTIVMEKKPKEELVPFLAHEYTHHILQILDGRREVNSPFEEGYARGVERKISAGYAQQRQYGGYVFSAFERTLKDLYPAYLWLCNHFGQKPRLSLSSPLLLLELDGIPPDAEQWYQPLRELDAYALGTSFFCLLEAAEGEGIYKAILHKEYGEA